MGTAPLDLDTARAGVALFDQTVAERNRLDNLCRAQAEEIEALRRDHAAALDRAQITINSQEQRIKELTHRADHYLRFATNIVARLTVIRQVMDEAQKLAIDDTFAKADAPPKPDPEKSAAIDQAGEEVAALLRRTQPASGFEPDRPNTTQVG